MIEWRVLHGRHWPLLNVITSCNENENERLSDVIRDCTLVCTVQCWRICHFIYLIWVQWNKHIIIRNIEYCQDKWNNTKGCTLLLWRSLHLKVSAFQREKNMSTFISHSSLISSQRLRLKINLKLIWPRRIKLSVRSPHKCRVKICEQQVYYVIFIPDVIVC